MKKSTLILLTCMAVGLSVPSVALARGADDHGGGTQSGSGQSGSGNGSGNGSGEAGDDHGSGSQPGDDRGGSGQPGDDRGGSGQPGDDRGNGGQSSSFQRTAVGLVMMPAASAFGLSGSVDIRAQGNKQRLKVEIEGRLPEGTQFQVLANGTVVGSITSHLEHGELELEVEDGAASRSIAPSAVNSIEVRDFSGISLLLGRFAELRNGTTPTPPAGVSKVEVVLTRASTSASSLGAAGRAELRVEGSQQEFQIKVDAAVIDGTEWQVFLNGIRAGTLRFRLNVAEFELESERLLPAGLTSIAAIRTVSVSDGTTTLLSANLK